MENDFARGQMWLMAFGFKLLASGFWLLAFAIDYRYAMPNLRSMYSL